MYLVLTEAKFPVKDIELFHSIMGNGYTTKQGWACRCTYFRVVDILLIQTHGIVSLQSSPGPKRLLEFI